MSGANATSEPVGDVFDEYNERFSNWGRWGDADQVGTTNFITRTMIREAARSVELGQAISLSLEFNADGPQTGANGRFNCLRYSVASGTDHLAGQQSWGGQPQPRGMGYADDTVVLHLQSATHWDSLCHIFHNHKMYNGFPAGEVSCYGSPHCGTEQLADRMIGRAVLVDVPTAKGLDALPDGYAITVDDLEATLEAQKVTIGEGDILLLRTGQMARCLEQGWGTFAGGDAPGLSFFTIPWLAERRIAAVASDTWGVEVRPNELPDSLQPFHIPALVYMGLPLGEMFRLDELAAACADDGRYDLFLAAPPVPFTGTAGGPPAPVAIR